METMTIDGHEIQIQYTSNYDGDYHYGYRVSDNKTVVINPDSYGAAGYAVADEGMMFENRGDGFCYYVDDGQWRDVHHTALGRGEYQLTDSDDLTWHWNED